MRSNYLTKIQIAFLLILQAFIFSACNDKTIVSTSNEAEANQMVYTLKEFGIEADRLTEGEEGKKVYSLHVADGFYSIGAATEAMRILDENCLPYKPPPPIAESGLVSSSIIDRVKQQRQDLINIETQIRQLVGVTCVKATLVYPQPDTDSYKPYPSSAAVTVTYRSEQPSFDENKIKNLIARSVPKLDPANVEVLIQYSPIRPAQLDTKTSWVKTSITATVGALLVGLTMGVIFFLRNRKSKEELEEEDDDELLLEENELLLASGEEEEEEV